MYTKNQPIRDLINANGIIVAAHRGTCGGNVIQNTILAYQNALLHGADMIEVDAAMTKDGVFYAFHNGEERLEFGVSADIRTMESKDAEALYAFNSIGHRSHQQLERLEAVLERFRGKCLINIDRSWFYWKEMISLLKRMDMDGQILLKSGAEERFLKELEDCGADIMYMPILHSPSEWELVRAHHVNVAAAELIFTDLESGFLKKEFMGELRRAGIAPWVNAITLDDDTPLSGGLDDNLAIASGFGRSWGRLMQLGFEIIQTDWPALLKSHIDGRTSFELRKTALLCRQIKL